MSWLVLGWAEEAPVADVYERVILTQMAARADPDGEGVYLSPATLARRAVSDEQTIKRRLRAMRERGVIAYGDQRRAAHIPKNRRPKVYDLMVPASAYTARDLRRVNEERAEKGRPPITADNRPDLLEVAPSRKTRCDVRAPAAADPDEQPMSCENKQGGLQDSPDLDPPDEPGGSTRPPQGGLQDPARGVYKTPKTVLSNQSYESGGGVTSQGNVTRARARTSDTRNAPPHPDRERQEQRPRCPRHEHLPDDDPGPPCVACRDVRVNTTGQADQGERERRAARIAARDACGLCDDAGWRLGPDREPLGRCDHQPAAPGRQVPPDDGVSLPRVVGG